MYVAGMMTTVNAQANNPLVELSQHFMFAAKRGKETDMYQHQLAALKYQDLVSQLSTDNEKKAFWINLYNGFTQARLKKDPLQYKSRGRFFKSREIQIAGKMFSLDQIEHGLLRHSKIKWSLGYLGRPFPGRTEKALRVSRLDYRIHFALNCGAKSCPPIAFYNSSQISRQLDLATRAYLNGESEYDTITNTIQLPAIMGWFRHDFGGKKKMIGLLQQYGVIGVDKHPAIRFKKYDWTLYLSNYAS